MPPYVFRRIQSHTDRMTIIETDLPGHSIEHELSEDYQSYLVEQPQPIVQTLDLGQNKPLIDWLEQAKRHKEKGNSLYRISDKFTEAEREYRRSIHCLRRVNRTPEIDEIRAQCYVNMAACDLALTDYASARKHATKAIKLDSKNIKALYRRSQARRYAAFDMEGAEADLIKAVEISPDDPTMKPALEQLRKDRAKAANEEAAVAKRMFKG